MSTRIDISTVLARLGGQDTPTTEARLPPVPETPLALLRLLREMHVTLRPDGDHLAVDVTTDNVTPAMHEALRQHKEALLTLLEWYEERAGILEYEAGLSRAEAEREAWLFLQERYGP